MPTKIEHASPDRKAMAILRTEIRRKTQRSRDSRLLYRLTCMLLLSEGQSPQRVSDWFGEHPRTLERWQQRFEEQGIAGLSDESSPGRPPRLSGEQFAELRTDISLPPYTFGYAANCWRGKVLQTHIERRYGVEISLRHCQRLLRGLRDTAESQFEAEEESQASVRDLAAET
jgi:transposase